MGVAFKPEEARESLKEYTGQVIDIAYSYEPFGMAGAVDIKRTGKVVCLKIQTDVYEKAQYELVPVESTVVEAVLETVCNTIEKSPEEEAILQYAIGFLEASIDGEGSISISKSKKPSKRGYAYQPRVQVCNTCIAFLVKVQIICGGGRITGGRRKSDWSKKVEFTLEMNRPQMKKWLPQLDLEVKEEQRKLMLDFLALMEGKQGGHSDAEWCELDSYYELMKLLNSGVPVVIPYWSRYKWYPPSKVKKTKWLYLVEALVQTGAMKDIVVQGVTDEEKVLSFAKSMLGMKFKWEERECESLVKVKGGEVKKFSVLLPVEYLGKSAIVAPPEVKTETVQEQLK